MHVDPEAHQVMISDVTLDWACLALWGPKARQVLETITGSDVSNVAIPYLHASWIDVSGEQVLAQRVSYVGELGWELYVRNERATLVWDLVYSAGQEFGLEVGGYKVLDPLRLEKGYRYFTADVTPMENPFEAGLGFCVDFDKGNFIGRDALLEAKESGIKNKLCTLVIEGDAYQSIYGGEAVYLDGRVVSRVRSGGYGFTTERNIAFAYLPLDLAKEGTCLEIDVFDARCSAEVTRNVLVDPKGDKLRA
jgi:4-methylaminobutanoate oxidase (formaldehyde-forming)